MDPFVSAFIVVGWTLLAGTVLFKFLPSGVAFLTTVAGTCGCGFLFTSGAYHLRNAYLDPFTTAAWDMLLIGFIWVLYLALPVIILAWLLSIRPMRTVERLRYSAITAVLQGVIGVVPSCLWLVVFSLE